MCKVTAEKSNADGSEKSTSSSGAMSTDSTTRLQHMDNATSAKNTADIPTSSANLVVSLDKSHVPRGMFQYLGVWFWVGTIFWYLVFLIGTPLFYHTITWKIWASLLVVATLVPCDRRFQPQICFDFGAWIIRKSVEYFHVKVVLLNEEAVRTSGTAIIAMEPHDVLPLSICGFSNCFQGLPGHRCVACVTSFCFQLPIMKHIYTWVNATAVDKRNVVRFLQSGVSPVICPGGVQEVTLMERDDECVLFLKSRLGFVKLAMQQGVPIIPVFSFGLAGTFDCWLPRAQWMKDFGRKIGFLPLVFFGLWGLPYSPGKPVDYTLVVGEPIKLPHLADPSLEEIHKYHAQYVHALETIFHTYKGRYGMAHVQLRIA